MNKITIEVPDNVQQITDASTGVVACVVMLFCGVVKGIFAAIKYLCSGVLRIAAGAVAGGCAAAAAK